MKTSHCRSLFSTIALTLVTFLASAQAQTTNDFKLSIHSNAQGYNLICESGCNWKTLEWKSGDKPTQQVSKTGISDNLAAKPENLTDFAFQLVKTEKGFDFVSVQGTDWKTLGFACPGKTCSMILTKSGVYGQ